VAFDGVPDGLHVGDGAAAEVFPPSGMVTSSSRRCTTRAYQRDASTWSASSSRPPGRSTRSISRIACRSSGMPHREKVHTTVSNEASGNSSACASPIRRSAAPTQVLRAAGGDLQHGRTPVDPGQPHRRGYHRSPKPGLSLHHAPRTGTLLSTLTEQPPDRPATRRPACPDSRSGFHGNRAAANHHGPHHPATIAHRPNPPTPPKQPPEPPRRTGHPTTPRNRPRRDRRPPLPGVAGDHQPHRPWTCRSRARRLATHSRGGVFRRCGCRHPQTGRSLDSTCPRLPERGHGSWYFDCPVVDHARAPGEYVLPVELLEEITDRDNSDSDDDAA
jgi:hypothetical protein